MTGPFSTKKSFFEALDRLDEWDEDNDCSFWGRVMGNKNTEEKETKAALSSDHKTSSASSEERHLCHTQVKRTSLPATLTPSSLDRQTIETMSTIKNGGPPHKKRRVHSVKVIPDDQQIFKGLVFCKRSRFLFYLAFTKPLLLDFFPNNDISPFRRLRIQRAQEYGARWSREWVDEITHVIVDKGLHLRDLSNHLQMESLPVSLPKRWLSQY
jgi:DNA polymerase IV